MGNEFGTIEMVIPILQMGVRLIKHLNISAMGSVYEI